MNTTAQQWAAGLKPGAEVSWRALEVNAFVDQPDVLDLLDPRGKHSDRRRRRRVLNRRFYLPLALHMSQRPWPRKLWSSSRR